MRELMRGGMGEALFGRYWSMVQILWRGKVRRLFGGTMLLAMVAVFGGCAVQPYYYSYAVESENTMLLRDGESQFEHGRPNAFIDGLGHYILSLPSKIMLWNWQVDRHYVSPLHEKELERYLEKNDLHSVKVRINQYAPGGEWSRLFRNSGVTPFWRYTIGILSMVNYTILPGRLFGGDNYNPYTNTINIYSNHPAILLHEAGHAKDFARRRRPWNGIYAALRYLPFVPLYQEAIATGDAVGYMREEAQTREEKRAYKVLYPAYGTYIAGQALDLSMANPAWWVRYVVYAGVVIPAHVVGRVKAAHVEDDEVSAELTR